jgi:hypothetical protein
MNKKIIVIIITLILTIESNSQKINESLINNKLISVPFLNNNGFYTLVKYGTNIPVINKNFDEIKILNDSFLKFNEDGKWGLLKMNGEIYLKNQFDIIQLNNNYIETKKNNIIENFDSLGVKIHDSKIKELFKPKKNIEDLYILPKVYYKYLIDTIEFDISDSTIISKDSTSYITTGFMSSYIKDEKNKSTFIKIEIRPALLIYNNIIKENVIKTNIFEDRDFKYHYDDEKTLYMHISSKEEFLGLYEDVEYIGNDLYSVSKFNLSEAFKKPRESPSDRLERMEKEAMMKIEYGNILDKIDYTISENHYRVIDGSGNKITPYIYNKISKFSNGLSLVAIKKEKTDNPYDIYSGFINTKGNVVIPLKNEYRSLGFYDGLALDVENSYQKNISFIDTTGKIAFQLNNEYQWLDDEDKYQYTNYTNYFLNFEDNILIVKNIKNQKKICIINKSGLVKTCGDWVSITKFHNKMSLVKNSNGKYAIIDTNGKYIVQPKYDFIFAFGNDYLSEKLFLNPYTKFYEKEIQENEPTGFDLSRYNYTFIKKFNMNDLFLVRKNNSIFYVDSMGFEYIEK